jgi:hypothetical protein
MTDPTPSASRPTPPPASTSAAPAPAAPQAPARRRRLGCGSCLLGCGGVVLLSCLAFCALGGWVYWMWQGEPRGWQRAEAYRAATTPQERDHVAANLENRLTRQSTFTDERLQTLEAGGVEARTLDRQAGQTGGAGPSGQAQPARWERQVRIETDEANAWLSERLRAWANNGQFELPPFVRDAAYWVEDGDPVVGLKINAPGFNQVVSARLHARTLPDGQAVVGLRAVRVGNLRVPMDRVIDWVESAAPADQRQFTAKARQFMAGHTFDPSWEKDGHTFRLTHLRFTDDAMELTLRAE